VKGRRVAGLVGDLAPAEAIFALKELVAGLGGTLECRTDGAALPAGNRSG
jgi:NADH-quinone oxidoreductase subunit G